MKAAGAASGVAPAKLPSAASRRRFTSCDEQLRHVPYAVRPGCRCFDAKGPPNTTPWWRIIATAALPFHLPLAAKSLPETQLWAISAIVAPDFRTSYDPASSPRLRAVNGENPARDARKLFRFTYLAKGGIPVNGNAPSRVCPNTIAARRTHRPSRGKAAER